MAACMTPIDSAPDPYVWLAIVGGIALIASATTTVVLIIEFVMCGVCADCDRCMSDTIVCAPSFNALHGCVPGAYGSKTKVNM